MRIEPTAGCLAAVIVWTALGWAQDADVTESRMLPNLPRLKVDDGWAAQLGIRKLTGKHLTLYTDLQTRDTLYALTVNGVKHVAGNPMLQTIQFKWFATGPGVFYADFNEATLPPGTGIAGNAALGETGGVAGTGVMKLAIAAGSQPGFFLH